MYISKPSIVSFCILSFLIGGFASCSMTSTREVRGDRPQVKAQTYVIPAEKQKEAAELYSKVYTESIQKERGPWAKQDAEDAVRMIFGQEQ